MLAKTFLIVVSLVTSLISGIAASVAQAAPPPNSPSPQAGRFARDLTISRSQEFFREGNVRLEREIQILQRRPQQQTPILKVDAAVEDRERPRLKDPRPQDLRRPTAQ